MAGQEPNSAGIAAKPYRRIGRVKEHASAHFFYPMMIRLRRFHAIPTKTTAIAASVFGSGTAETI